LQALLERLGLQELNERFFVPSLAPAAF